MGLQLLCRLVLYLKTGVRSHRNILEVTKSHFLKIVYSNMPHKTDSRCIVTSLVCEQMDRHSKGNKASECEIKELVESDRTVPSDEREKNKMKESRDEKAF